MSRKKRVYAAIVRKHMTNSRYTSVESAFGAYILKTELRRTIHPAIFFAAGLIAGILVGKL